MRDWRSKVSSRCVTEKVTQTSASSPLVVITLSHASVACTEKTTSELG